MTERHEQDHAIRPPTTEDVHMNRHESFNTPVDAPEVDLDATRRRLLLAREQCGSQRSTRHLRTAAARRRWPTPSERGSGPLGS
jgi:hypothetical protein